MRTILFLVGVIVAVAMALVVILGSPHDVAKLLAIGIIAVSAAVVAVFLPADFPRRLQ